MKRLIKTACSIAICVLCGGAAAGAPITIVSTGGDPANQFNDSTALIPAPYASAATVAITQHPAWASALPGSNWVSFHQTGWPIDYMAPNGTIVTFTHAFLMPAGFNSATGSLTVMADDSASVWLNGTLLFPEAPSANNYTNTCSDVPIGCLVQTHMTLELSPEMFNYGALNTLEFKVAQRGSYAFGLDYAGEIQPTPEPATYALIGAGLAAIALIRRRSL